MSSRENLIIRFLTDGITEAVRAFSRVDDSLGDLDEAARRAEEAIRNVGQGSTEAARIQELAMRQLGLRSEQTANQQKQALLDAYERIRQSGTATPAEIARAWDRTQERIAQINRSIARNTESSFSRIARNSIARLNTISGAFRRIGSRAALIGGGAVVGGAAAGIGVARSVSDQAFEIDRISKLIGESAQDFQEVAFAARSVGIETDQVGDILKDLNDRIGEVSLTGGGALAEYFAVLGPKLGLVPKNIAELEGSAEVLQAAASKFFAGTSGPIEGLQKLAEVAAKAGTNLEQDTFLLESIASDATLLRTLLADNAAGLNELRATARESGNLFSDEDIEKAMELRAQFSLMSLDLQGVGIALFRSGLAEGVSSAFGSVSESLSLLRDRINANSEAVEARIAAFAEKVGSVVSDVIALLSGDRDAVENQWLLDLVDGAETLGRVMSDVVLPAFGALLNGLDRLNNTGGLGKMAAGAVVIGAVLGPIVTGVVAIGGAVARMLPLIGRLIGFALGLGGAFSRFLALARTAALAVGGLVAVVGGIPVAIGAAIIAALVAVGFAIYTWWDEISAFFSDSFNSIGEWLGDALLAPLKNFAKRAKEIFAGLRPGEALRGIGSRIADALPGFRSGGFTGNTREGDIAGVVHGREYVFPAAAVRRWGVGSLEALAAGIVPPSMARAMAPAIAAPTGGGGRQLGTVRFDFGGQQIEASMDEDNWRRLEREARRRQATSAGNAGRFAK